MYVIDKTDMEIVNILLEDGRISASEIARRLENVSERAVRYRIDRMLEENVFHVAVVIHPDAFGLQIKADVLLEVESDRISDVAKKLTRYDNVTYVACGIGETDVSIQMVARNTDEVYRFVTETVRKIPGVRRTTTSIVPLILKDVYQWRIPDGVISNRGRKKTD
jgi:Lrp/AsnC family transcriptional regulator for asnA, asnC and gidA